MEGDAVVQPLSARYRRWVGPVAERRGPPSLSTSLAGAAAAVAAVALASLGGEAVSEGSTGVAVLAALGFGGVGLLLLTQPLPLRAAGVVAVGASVLLALAFLLVTDEGYSRGDLTATVATSSAVWAALHFLGPARGSPLLLGAALVGAWQTFALHAGLVGFPTFPVFTTGETFPFPFDTTELVIASLAFGVVYLMCADALDRAGLVGTATVFAAAGLLALGTGVWAGALGRHPAMGALLLTLAGALAAVVGGRARRRLTTWLGAAGVAAGLAVMASEIASGQSGTAGPALALAASALLVLFTPAVARLAGEDEAPNTDA